MHAFWRVALDVLEGMDALNDGRRKLETADCSRAEGRVQRHRLQERKQQGWRRRLFSDFGGDFAVYFESMKMHVEDVGESFLISTNDRTCLAMQNVLNPFLSLCLECSGGLAYAVEGAPCITFEYTLVPLPGGPLTERGPLQRAHGHVPQHGGHGDGIAGEGHTLRGRVQREVKEMGS